MPSCRRATMLRRQSRLAREVVFRSTWRRGRLHFDSSTYHSNSSSSSDHILNNLCSGGRGLSGRASGPVGFVGLGNMGEVFCGICVVFRDHVGRAVLLTLYRIYMYRITRSTIFEEDPPSSGCWLVGCLALLLCCCCCSVAAASVLCWSCAFCCIVQCCSAVLSRCVVCVVVCCPTSGLDS